jgi:hypothetical protein
VVCLGLEEKLLLKSSLEHTIRSDRRRWTKQNSFPTKFSDEIWIER